MKYLLNPNADNDQSQIHLSYEPIIFSTSIFDSDQFV